MNFLWDMAIRAENQGIAEEELFFVQAEDYSPFYEQAFSCLNETKMKAGEVELNLFLRFADIFQEILSDKGDEFPSFRKYLVDVALHLILHTDLRHGLTKKEVYIKQILEELRNGTFSKGMKKGFEGVPRQKQGRVAALMLSQMQNGSSMEIFRRGLRIFYPDAVLYQIRNDRKKLLLYLSDKKTEQKEQMMNLVQEMFLPIHYDLRIFWEYHFGIIGVEDTMKIEEIAIY